MGRSADELRAAVVACKGSLITKQAPQSSFSPAMAVYYDYTGVRGTARSQCLWVSQHNALPRQPTTPQGSDQSIVNKDLFTFKVRDAQNMVSVGVGNVTIIVTNALTPLEHKVYPSCVATSRLVGFLSLSGSENEGGLAEDDHTGRDRREVSELHISDRFHSHKRGPVSGPVYGRWWLCDEVVMSLACQFDKDAAGMCVTQITGPTATWKVGSRKG